MMSHQIEDLYNVELMEQHDILQMSASQLP